MRSPEQIESRCLAGCIVAAALLSVLAPMTLPAGAQQQAPYISTSGNGVVRVKPDTARIVFLVTKRAATVAAARALNVESAAAATKSLDGLGIPGLKAKTSAVEVRILWDNYEQSLNVRGYEMTSIFTVTLTDADVDRMAKSTARVVDTALEAGANGIQGVSFLKADDSAERRECLKLAVADARRNAEALAQAAGVRITGVQSIYGTSETRAPGVYGPGGSGDYLSKSAASVAREPSSYQPGEIELRFSATVSFKIG